MNFKGQYLTHDEYQDLGGLLKEVPFNLLEYDARKMIDERTFGRLINIATKEIPFDVKVCIYEMIEVKEGYQSLKTQNKAIASESTDGYNVTYRKQETSDIEAENKELMNIIESNLSNVVINNIPVLYLGVDQC
jgi:hypothetical protein